MASITGPQITTQLGMQGTPHVPTPRRARHMAQFCCLAIVFSHLGGWAAIQSTSKKLLLSKWGTVQATYVLLVEVKMFHAFYHNEFFLLQVYNVIFFTLTNGYDILHDTNMGISRGVC